jgi:hypothetical protein
VDKTTDRENNTITNSGELNKPVEYQQNNNNNTNFNFKAVSPLSFSGSGGTPSFSSSSSSVSSGVFSGNSTFLLLPPLPPPIAYSRLLSPTLASSHLLSRYSRAIHTTLLLFSLISPNNIFLLSPPCTLWLEHFGQPSIKCHASQSPPWCSLSSKPFFSFSSSHYY